MGIVGDKLNRKDSADKKKEYDVEDGCATQKKRVIDVMVCRGRPKKRDKSI